MNDINTIQAEKENLELHVDLCAQRYLLLEKRLATVEVKVDGISQAIQKHQSGLSTVIIGSAGTVVSGLLAVVITILMKF